MYERAGCLHSRSLLASVVALILVVGLCQCATATTHYVSSMFGDDGLYILDSSDAANFRNIKNDGTPVFYPPVDGSAVRDVSIIQYPRRLVLLLQQSNVQWDV